MPHACLIIGHTPDAPGATSVDGTTEHAYNSALAELVRERLLELGFEISIVHRGRPNDYAGLPAFVNRTGADFAVSLHFNGHYSATARGAEVLCWSGSSNGLRLAKHLQREFEQLGFQGRGVKPIWSRGDRGGHLLEGTTMPTVIAEPGFGSNAADWHRLSDRGEIASAYVRGIVAYASETASRARGGAE